MCQLQADADALTALGFAMQHYISFHTYAFFGFMHNEFDGVDDWEVRHLAWQLQGRCMHACMRARMCLHVQMRACTCQRTYSEQASRRLWMYRKD